MTFDPRLFHHLFQPWYATHPKVACLDCETSWRSDEGVTCWMCGGEGITGAEFYEQMRKEQAARLERAEEDRAQTSPDRREEPTSGQAP